MTPAKPEKSSHELPDDYWIFEELGSPVKLPRTQQTSPESSTSSKALCKNEFEEKLRIYADNMRKLIITARKSINDLKQENLTLKRKLESSGLIECPACLYHFKPEKKDRILPKYVKIFRGKLALEVEFSSLDEMSEWLTLNQLDENSDGLPTMLQKEEKLDLTTTGSLLHSLLSERKEMEAKRERVVISTRRRLNNPAANSSSTTAQPASRALSQRSHDIGKAEILKNEPKERYSSPYISHESPSPINVDRSTENLEERVKRLTERLPFRSCVDVTNSLNEATSMEMPRSGEERQMSRGNHDRNSENSSRDMQRSKGHKMEVSLSKGDPRSRRTERGREDSRRPGADKHEEAFTSSTSRRSHDAGIEEDVRRSSKSGESHGKRSRVDDNHNTGHLSSRSHEIRHHAEKETESTSKKVMKNDRNNDSRHPPPGKENIAHHKEVDRDKSQRANSLHHRRVDRKPNERLAQAASSGRSSRSSVEQKDFKPDRHSDSRRHESRREHESTRDSVKHHSDWKDVRNTRTDRSIQERSGKLHRDSSTRESRDQHPSKRRSPARRSPQKLSHRTEHVHGRSDSPNGLGGPRNSDEDRAASIRSERSSERHGHSRRERIRESAEKSHRSEVTGSSSKKRRLSTSTQRSADGGEQELVVSDIDLVMVDEDEVEDGEVMD